jgi:hypothetical protein
MPREIFNALSACGVSRHSTTLQREVENRLECYSRTFA